MHTRAANVNPSRDAPRRRLRVGINLLWLVPDDVGGTEDYAVTLVNHLAATGDLDVVVFCQPQLRTTYPDLAASASVVLGPRSGHARTLRLLAENTWLPYEIRRRRLDVVHHLGGTIPMLAPGPSILTVYDLQPLTHPERFSPLKRAWLRAVLPRSTRRASVVHVLSEHVCRELVHRLEVPTSRTIAAPPGAERRQQLGPEAVTATLRRYRLREPLLLYPAITYPHKNHEVLVRALPAILEHHPDTTLVLTGRPGPYDPYIDRLIRRRSVGHAIRRLGRIPSLDLEALYEAAAALVFPSIHEGFGLPLLEAMVHRCPIIAAAASAIPEVAGGYGVLLEPDDPAAWADAINRLLDVPVWRRALADASARGAEQFTWESATSALLDAYHSAVRIGAAT